MKEREDFNIADSIELSDMKSDIVAEQNFQQLRQMVSSRKQKDEEEVEEVDAQIEDEYFDD